MGAKVGIQVKLPDAAQLMVKGIEGGREVGEGGPAENWRLPQQGKFGEQLLAGCGEHSLWRHGGGGVDDQQPGCPELVARMKKLKKMNLVQATQSQAWSWSHPGRW